MNGMATATRPTPPGPATRAKPGLAVRTARYLVRMRFAGAGAIILLLIFLLGIFAPWLTPYDPSAVSLSERLLPPGTPGHLLGTDAVGQDILTRVLYGARISLLVSFSVVAISSFIGVLLGLLAGYYGRRVDDVIMRIGDILLAFPSIILFLAVLAVLGPGLAKLIAVLGLVGWVAYARVARSMVLSLREREYVVAARATGTRDRLILLRHILPNILGPITVVASFGLATAIIAESSLSFLGLGVPPSIPSWGNMLSSGRDYLRTAWWLGTFPGIALTLTVLAINLLGDWLRDELDPVLRKL